MQEKFPSPEELSENVSESNLFERIMRTARKVIAISMIGIATAQSFEKGAYAHETPIKSKSKEVSKLLTSDEVRRGVIEDDSEQFFIEKDGDLYSIGGGDKSSGFIEFQDIQNVIDSGEKSPIIGHTHPVSAYDNAGYSKATIIEIRERKKAAAPMPPSLDDILGAINIAQHFADQDVAVRHRIYDPTGLWEYTIDRTDDDVINYGNFGVNIRSAIQAALSDADRRHIEESGLESAHPQNYVKALKSKDRTHDLGKRIENAAMHYVEQMPRAERKAISGFTELEDVSKEIVHSRNVGLMDLEEEDIDELVGEYIEIAGDLGVKVSYEPYTYELDIEKK